MPGIIIIHLGDFILPFSSFFSLDCQNNFKSCRLLQSFSIVLGQVLSDLWFGFLS
ncbi:hypothetical protein CHCC20335_0781 [Bacillus paralicheniformis]|nr:hypothetical protein CHCC20335_0781 [Bacillus paralicheniformis]